MVSFISRMMNPLSIELVRVQAILHANTIDMQVDGDMIMALNQMYANDPQTLYRSCSSQHAGRRN